MNFLQWTTKVSNHDTTACRIKFFQKSCIYMKSIDPKLSNDTRFFKIRPFYDDVAHFELNLLQFFSSIFKIVRLFSWIHSNIDAKKESRLKTVFFFDGACNILMKSDKNVKFGKSMRLWLMSMKIWFGRTFCHSRASGDPLK